MAKQSTHPVILENRLSLSTKMLNQLSLLKRDIKLNRVITWRSTNIMHEGEICGSINLLVNAQDGFSYLELEYTHDGRPLKYKVQLEFFPSNLGIGEVVYFTCPSTSNRCRKLYLYHGYFVSRHAIKYGCYKQQVESKKTRVELIIGERINKYIRILQSTQKPGFKSIYAGRVTKIQSKALKAYEMISLLTEI